MKTPPLKFDPKIFDEAEKITSHRRRKLKEQLAHESKITAKHSLKILREFEKLIDEN